MEIIYSPMFESQLMQIVDYIAIDKPRASIEFALKLEKTIFNLVHSPFKCRKSVYFDDVNIRDMTYKKYTITYRVKPIKNEIEILRIFNRNKPTR